MPRVCLYFQVHQPYRLRRYSYFDIGQSSPYFDDELNRSIMTRVARNCYLPANRALLQLIRQHKGEFKVAFSMTGTALDQMVSYTPEVLESFRELAATGAVEFLGETYYHSLAMLYDLREYREQVREHSRAIEREFGQRPRVLRNTELLYSDEAGLLAEELGFNGVVAEGVDDILGWRSPNFVYRVPERTTRILLRNYRLSDDIAFRFSRGAECGHRSLRAADFAGALHSLTGNCELVGLFLDYETFGEHHKASSGIFDFLLQLPQCVLADREWSFVTPSECIAGQDGVEELSFPRLTSWADTARDESAWRGNQMQVSALEQIYNVRNLLGEREVYAASMESMRETWRRLQTSDHFYYMCTKGSNDGEVHSYFNSFESPYEAFIAYMNVLKDFGQRRERAGVGGAHESPTTETSA